MLASAERLVVPSGQDVLAIEYLSDVDGQGDVLRARYHAPALTGSDNLDLVFADMMHLCEVDALSMRATMTPPPPRIIVSLSSKALPLGEIDASVAQYFEAYRVENGRCVWELF